MFLNRKILLLIALVGFISFTCNEFKKTTNEKINFNIYELDSLLNVHGDNIAILSCLRCQCFVNDFNRRFSKAGKKPLGYILLTDTSCNKLLFSVRFISSNTIEKISEDFYNLILIKKSGTDIRVKIVEVENSNNADVVAENFFTND